MELNQEEVNVLLDKQVRYMDKLSEAKEIILDLLDVVNNYTEVVDSISKDFNVDLTEYLYEDDDKNNADVITEATEFARSL